MSRRGLPEEWKMVSLFLRTIRTDSVHFEVCSGFSGNKNAPDVSIEGEWSRDENSAFRLFYFVGQKGRKTKLSPAAVSFIRTWNRQKRSLPSEPESHRTQPSDPKARGVAVSQRKADYRRWGISPRPETKPPIIYPAVRDLSRGELHLPVTAQRRERNQGILRAAAKRMIANVWDGIEAGSAANSGWDG